MKRCLLWLRGHDQWPAFKFDREDFSRGYPLYSVSLFCPICCKVWGGINVEGDKVLFPHTVSCVECNWADGLCPVPGSVLVNNIFSSGIDWELLDLLPDWLVKREFELTLDSQEAYLCQVRQLQR
jgi:hypothetical protein